MSPRTIQTNITGSYRKTNIFPCLRLFTNDGEVTTELLADGELLERYQGHALQSAVYQTDLVRLVKLCNDLLLNSVTTEKGYISTKLRLSEKVCDMKRCNELIDAAKALSASSDKPIIFPKVENLYANGKSSIEAGSVDTNATVDETFLSTLFDRTELDSEPSSAFMQSSFLSYIRAPRDFDPETVEPASQFLPSILPSKSLAASNSSITLNSSAAHSDNELLINSAGIA